jgi:hypothetical protein
MQLSHSSPQHSHGSPQHSHSATAVACECSATATKQALQKWEIDPRHRDLVKTVSRVVQSMEVKALDAVESMLGNGTVEGATALQHLKRLSGHEGDMAVAAHTLRRTPRTRNALVGLVGTEMLVAGGSTFERTGTQIHASKTLQADLLWAQTRFIDVLNACYEVS